MIGLDHVLAGLAIVVTLQLAQFRYLMQLSSDTTKALTRSSAAKKEALRVEDRLVLHEQNHD